MLRFAAPTLLCLMAVASQYVIAAEPKPTSSDEPATIPLDQIWAYQMRGLKSVFDLEPLQQSEDAEHSLANTPSKTLSVEIAKALSADISRRWPRDDESAGPGFAVRGVGRQALESLYDIMVRDQRPAECFSTDDDVSLVFLMYQFGSYAEIQTVERRSNNYEIQWRFIQPIDQTQAAHFALIPCGQLPAGKYHVEMKQMPSGMELETLKFGNRNSSKDEILNSQKFGDRFVNGSFSFEVRQGQP
jgi:hypothetical protein